MSSRVYIFDFQSLQKIFWHTPLKIVVSNSTLISFKKYWPQVFLNYINMSIITNTRSIIPKNWTNFNQIELCFILWFLHVFTWCLRRKGKLEIILLWIWFSILISIFFSIFQFFNHSTLYIKNLWSHTLMP